MVAQLGCLRSLPEKLFRIQYQSLPLVDAFLSPAERIATVQRSPGPELARHGRQSTRRRHRVTAACPQCSHKLPMTTHYLALHSVKSLESLQTQTCSADGSTHRLCPMTPFITEGAIGNRWHKVVGVPAHVPVQCLAVLAAWLSFAICSLLGL